MPDIIIRENGHNFQKHETNLAEEAKDCISSTCYCR